MSQDSIQLLDDHELVSQGQNSLFLKQQALEVVQQVCEQSWTDHNASDPGVTLLEVLAFAISDLSYKLDFPIRDLLAPPDTTESRQAFYLPPEVFPSNIVTQQDLIQALLDIPGIQNVSSAPAEWERPPGSTIQTNSLDIYLDLEDAWYDKSTAEQAVLFSDVRQRFLSLRNLNQDLNQIHVIQKHDFSISMSAAFERVDDPVERVAEVLAGIRKIVTPQVQRYSLIQMQQQGLSGDQIYQGPLNENGFLQADDLEALAMPNWLYVSDILEHISKTTGLTRVANIRFKPSEEDHDNLDKGYLHWRLKIKDNHVARLNIADNLDRLKITIDDQHYPLSAVEKQQILNELDSAAPLASERSEHQLLERYVFGRYRDLSEYISIQSEFPEMYHLIESRLDQAVDSAHAAGILQFKGFLTLFDQVLADEMAQLENLRQLLALPDPKVFKTIANTFNRMLASEFLGHKDISAFWDCVRQLPRTEFSQGITDVSGMKHLLDDYFSTYQAQGFQAQIEPVLSQSQLSRLTRSMEHVLARFAETRLDANLLKYGPVFSHYIEQFEPVPADISQDQPLLQQLVSLKSVIDMVALLTDLPMLTQQRGGGANYLRTPVKLHHTAGFSQRLMRYLGFSHPGQIPLATNNKESLYLVESELLRFADLHGTANNYQKNQIYILLPDWPTRLANPEFVQLIKHQIARNIPVEQKVHILRLNRQEMGLFEHLYYAWLNVFSQIPLQVNQSSRGDIEQVSTLSTRLAEFFSSDLSLQQYLLTKLDGEQLKQQIRYWLASTDHDQLAGGDLEAITLSLDSIIKAHPEAYQHLTGENILYDIAHHCIQELVVPTPVSTGEIGKNFTIGFQALEYLKPVAPIGLATVNSRLNARPSFNLDITEPNTL